MVALLLCGQRAVHRESGEVLYLGYFDARKALGELNSKVVASGRLSTSGSPVQFFDAVAAPPFLPVNERGMESVRAWAKAAMPRTTVEPKAAILSNARFGTGTSLVGQRICGGYFAERRWTRRSDRRTVCCHPLKAATFPLYARLDPEPRSIPS